MKNSMTQKQIGGIVVFTFLVAFILGIFFAPKSGDMQQSIADLKKRNTELEDRNQGYARLKSIDDLSFQYCGEMVGNLTDGLKFAFERNVEGMNGTTEKMKIINEKMETQVTDRKKVLETLGY